MEIHIRSIGYYVVADEIHATPNSGSEQTESSIGLRIRVCHPSTFDRTTGVVREVGGFERISPAEMSLIQRTGSRVMNEQEAVIAVLLHRVTRKVAALGPFTNSNSALEWWNFPENAFAADPAMEFVMLTPARA